MERLWNILKRSFNPCYNGNKVELWTFGNSQWYIRVLILVVMEMM